MQVPDSLPNHIGFIVDGNRRWAKELGKSAQFGHKAGSDNLKKVIDYCIESGIPYVSAYVFSTENWQRAEKEVSFLMKLTTDFMKKDLSELHEKGVKVVHVGSRVPLSPKVLQAVDKAVEQTKDNTNITIGLCFNYSGQVEIAEATQSIIRAGLEPEAVTPEVFEQYLYAPDIPPVDFVVRTSGEHRLSNFMLWRAAYAELYFPDVKWPDFDQAAFTTALNEYASRQRRFGN